MSGMTIAVLGGAGAMGRIIIRDLVESPGVGSVVVGDLPKAAPEAFVHTLGSPKATAIHVDVTKRDELVKALTGVDVVINSVQYYFNVDVMEGALAARCHYVDLGGLFHMTRTQMELAGRFTAAGLVAVLGCGSTPGITNMMARYAADRLDTVTGLHVKVGAVDLAPAEGPLASPYSIMTILDECTLKPMVYQGGEFMEVAPFSGEEWVAFPHPVGTALANFSLHSEVASFPRVFADKGIRDASFRIAFPAAFREQLKLLVDLGLAATDPVDVRGCAIKPRDLLVACLNRLPQPEGDPQDVDVLRLEATGTAGGRPAAITVESIIEPHPRWKVSAGALDTGVPASIVAQQIGAKIITAPGVWAPEEVVPVDRFFADLAERTIRCYALARDILP